MCSQNIYPLSIKSDTKSMETNAGTDLIYLADSLYTVIWIQCTIFLLKFVLTSIPPEQFKQPCSCY